MDRQETALLWHGLGRSAPWGRIFDRAEDWIFSPVPHPAHARLMRPGLVGTNYEPGGIVIVNERAPGARVEHGHSPLDVGAYHRTLDEFHHSTRPEDVLSRFEALMAFTLQLAEERRFNGLTNACFDALPVGRDRVSFLHLVPYPVRDDAWLNTRIMDRAFETVLSHQMEALAPRTIIAIGRSVENALVRNGVEVDWMVPPATCETEPGREAMQTLAMIAEQFKGSSTAAAA
ncbi:MAG: hypothetical protein MI741_04405 [Rhodospirillales bacterium]|nr:hypothetical protein [Rhodospirillales bacterium]